MTATTLAAVFPGQGSQSVGMLAALAEAFPPVRATFDEAAEALSQDLWALVSAGPSTELDRTENTQPIMLTADIAVWRVWRAAGGALPAVMAGHSLGEYAALVAADALTLGEGVRLARDRAHFMQQAVPVGEGSMAALLGLSDEQVAALCASEAEGEVLSAVNFNAPGQVVIAGTRSAVERAVAAAKPAGAKRAVLLPVSVPSHCALMAPAAERLAARLADLPLRLPAVPLLHNASVTAAADVGELRDQLVRQLHSPVRWVETVRALAGRGVRLVLEFGPGKVLTGLGKRIDSTLNSLPVQDPESLAAALEASRDVDG